MHFPTPKELISFPKDQVPHLIVVVDVEEEFDWSKPFSRDETGVENVNELWRAQEIFDARGIKPTYVIDYPVATTPSPVAVIKEIYDSGRCDIGAQLHPWVNPPFEEDVTTFNSFPGNLPRALELAKLRALTEAIEENVGVRPTIYRAGRYGFGPNTTGILEELGYEIDMSVVPYTDFSDEGGPDYSQAGPEPYWFGENKRLLEIPLTCGFSGRLSSQGPQLFPIIGSRTGERLKLRSAAARLSLIDRVRLTPEGMTVEEMHSVTRQLIADGQKVFQLSFHSSSLLPGHTDYARNVEERDAFVQCLSEVLAPRQEISWASSQIDTLQSQYESLPRRALDDLPIDRVQTNNPFIVPPQLEPEAFNYWRRRAVGRLSNRHVPGEKQDIYMFSSPRSGSTFLMELIGADPKIKMIDEPLSPRKPTVWRELGTRTWRDVTLMENREEKFASYFGKLRANQIPELNPPFYSSERRPSTDRIVFKIIHGGEDMLDWFETRLNGQILILVRHPIPTALSHRQNPRLPYLIQHVGLTRHLTDRQISFAKSIFETGSYFERSIVDWCLQNFLLLREDIPEHWVRVHYEDLVRYPRETYDSLCMKLDLSPLDRLDSLISRPSSSAIQSDPITQDLIRTTRVGTDHSELLERWRQRVDLATEERVFDILHAFTIHCFDSSSSSSTNLKPHSQRIVGA